MAESRHKVTIEVNADTRKAAQAIRGLEGALDHAAGKAGAAFGGGGGSGGAGGGGGGARGAVGTGLAMAGTAYLASQQSAMQIAHSFASASPAFGLQTAGALTTGAMMGMGGALAHSKSQTLQGVGAALGGIAPGIGGLVEVGVQALNQRYQVALQKAQVDKAMGLAGLSGVGAHNQSFYGYGPEEAAQLSQSYGQAVGFHGKQPDIFPWLRRGVGLGALAGYRGLQAAGVGGVGDAGGEGLRRNVAMAFKEGLRGSNVDRWLGVIAANTQGLGRQGIDVNTAGMETFIRSMQATGGAFAGQGMRLPQVAAGLSGAYGSAREMLVGPMRQFGAMAVLAQAGRSGGGIMGALAALESAEGSPEKARQAALAAGPGAAQAYFASIGATSGMAKALAGPMQSGVFDSTSIPAAGGLGLSEIIAKGERHRLSTMGMKEATETIAGVESLKDVMNDLGGSINELISTIRASMDQARKDFAANPTVSGGLDAAGKMVERHLGINPLFMLGTAPGD